MALIESLLYQLKYVGNKAIGVFFDQKLAGLISGLACAFDGIIGVPLHPKRQRKRGFNQVDLIGQSAAKALSITYYGTFLERIKHTPKLSKASRDRTEILQDAFRINPLIKLPKGHYLLLDDILTTGVTLKACSKLLVKIDHLSLSIATIVYRN
jgi:competence protein ComFC